jgi:hypothetical protein
MGGQRGPGSPRRGIVGLSEVAHKSLDIARQIIEALPRISLPSPRNPITPSKAMDFFMNQVMQRDLELRRRKKMEEEQAAQPKPAPPTTPKPGRSFRR